MTPDVKMFPVNEVAQALEAFIAPTEGGVAMTWIRRPTGWYTLVAHVPPAAVKTKAATVATTLLTDLTKG